MDTIDRETPSKKPAAERHERKKILRAKPAKDAVDHGALTDKIIARFPNILKALAE